MNAHNLRAYSKEESMKLSGLKHIRRLLLAVILILAAGYVSAVIKYQCEIPIYQVYSCLKLFIQENKRMPTSQKELMEKGYLRVEGEDDKHFYSIRCDHTEVFTRVPAAENEKIPECWLIVPYMEFFIRYGIQKDDLFIRDDIVCDKITGEKVLLFTGPKSFILSGTYRKLSTALYKELMKNEGKGIGEEKK